MSRRAARVVGPVNGVTTLRRYRQVARVLVAHGLADMAHAIGLSRYIAWGKRIVPGGDASLSRAARVRRALEDLGPTFVKFGQALSLRSDVLPVEFITELAMLQERVTPMAPGLAEAAIEAEFQQPIDRLFVAFDAEPLAAGSVAQVHRALLPSGDVVAVKVRRPGVVQTMTADVEMLRQLARLVERYVPAASIVDLPALVDEFARTVRTELDLKHEARHLEQCARNFLDDATVKFPAVCWDRTTSAVLTMEFLDGRKLGELIGGGAAFERGLIARRGADAMLKQVLVHGLFHADPHPGNLLILPEHVIGFLDLGIVGRVDAAARRDLARVIRAMWQRDAVELTALALEIMETTGEVEVRALTRDIAGLIDLYGDVPLSDLSVTSVLTDIVATASRHRLRFPSHLMLLIKSLVTIEGVGLQLDPSFRIVDHAAPLAERLWREQFAPEALATRGLTALHRAGRTLRDLPGQLETITRKLRDGRLEVRLVHRNLDHFVSEMDRSSNRLAFALIIAALIVGSSLVIQAGRGAVLYGYPLLGLAGFVVAGLFGVRLAIGIVRSGRL